MIQLFHTIFCYLGIYIVLKLSFFIFLGHTNNIKPMVKYACDTHVSNNVCGGNMSMSTNQGPSTLSSCDKVPPQEPKTNTSDKPTGYFHFPTKQSNFICQPETNHDRTSKMVPSNGNAKKELAFRSPLDVTEYNICFRETEETIEKTTDNIPLPIEEDSCGGIRKMDFHGKTVSL